MDFLIEFAATRAPIWIVYVRWWLGVALTLYVVFVSSWFLHTCRSYNEFEDFYRALSCKAGDKLSTALFVCAVWPLWPVALLLLCDWGAWHPVRTLLRCLYNLFRKKNHPS